MNWTLEDLGEGDTITLWIDAQPLNFRKIDKWKLGKILEAILAIIK